MSGSREWVSNLFVALISFCGFRFHDTRCRHEIGGCAAPRKRFKTYLERGSEALQDGTSGWQWCILGNESGVSSVMKVVYPR